MIAFIIERRVLKAIRGAGGHVTAGAEAIDPGVRITVTDTGESIAAEHLRHIV